MSDAKPWEGLWDVVTAQGVSMNPLYPYQSDREAVESANRYTKEPMNARSGKPYRAVPWTPKPITTGEVVESARVRCAKVTTVELRLLATISAATAARDEWRGRARRMANAYEAVMSMPNGVHPDGAEIMREAELAFADAAMSDEERIARINATLSPSPTTPACGMRCWDVDLCCGDDLCRFDNGESLPIGVYCSKHTTARDGAGEKGPA